MSTPVVAPSNHLHPNLAEARSLETLNPSTTDFEATPRHTSNLSNPDSEAAHCHTSTPFDSDISERIPSHTPEHLLPNTLKQFLPDTREHRRARTLRRLRPRTLRDLRTRTERGAATAEYAVTIVAACGLGGILVALLKSPVMQNALKALINYALKLAGVDGVHL